jgi:hypothetical protein
MHEEDNSGGWALLKRLALIETGRWAETLTLICTDDTDFKDKIPMSEIGANRG